VIAVEKARQTVENDKVDVIFGPVFSPATAAITDYLAKAGGIPDISIFGQPHNNLATANKLAFIPAGMHSFQGYILGKYAAEELHYKTATIINYEEDTGHDIAEGFTKGFGEGGGQVVQTQFVPIDVIDFSSYLTTLKKADCTSFWIFGNGSGPFVKQYHDYGIKQPLVMSMADNIQEPTLAELGDISLDIIATDHYIPLLDNDLNNKFVADYTKQWNGEQPNMDSFAGWLAVNLFLKAVEKTNGDTSPKAIIEAMSNMSLDTPAGKYTMSPYGDAYIGTGNFYICKSVRLDNGRYTWQPFFTYDQIRFEDKR
jgi:branched-chain amino acid transport system substrate-binding protein